MIQIYGAKEKHGDRCSGRHGGNSVAPARIAKVNHREKKRRQQLDTKARSQCAKKSGKEQPLSFAELLAVNAKIEPGQQDVGGDDFIERLGREVNEARSRTSTPSAATMAAGVPLARFAHAYPNQIVTSEISERTIAVPSRYPADAAPIQAVARITPARNVGKTQRANPKPPLPGNDAIAKNQPVRRLEGLKNFVGKEDVGRAHCKTDPERECGPEQHGPRGNLSCARHCGPTPAATVFSLVK